MITPRLPLYIVSMYASVVYLSTTAARRFGFGYLPEAALCGLFAHLFYNVYDTNGPRYLWWTWHDGDPSIGVRHANAPTSSSIWILTYLACHSLLARWVNDPAISLEAEVMTNIIKNLPLDKIIKNEIYRTKFIDLVKLVFGKIDSFHQVLIRLPNIIKIAFCGFVCTPMFMTLMGQAQIFSLDTIGIPAKRSYNFLILLYSLLTLHSIVNRKGHWTRFQQPGKLEYDLDLLKWVAIHYATQSTIAVMGEPTAHVSTGCHQTYSRRGEHIAYDLVGLKRDDCVSGDGPHLNSKYDYAFAKESKVKYDAAGQLIITPKLEEESQNRADHEWYTVVGIPHKDKAWEIGNVLLISAVGMYCFTRAFTRTAPTV